MTFGSVQEDVGVLVDNPLCICSGLNNPEELVEQARRLEGGAPPPAAVRQAYYEDLPGVTG